MSIKLAWEGCYEKWENGIKYGKAIVPDAPRRLLKVYDGMGIEAMNFHARNFGSLQ